MRGIRDWIFFKPRKADYEDEDVLLSWPTIETFVRNFTFNGRSTNGPFTHTFTPSGKSEYYSTPVPRPNLYKNGPPLVVSTNTANFPVPITPTNTISFVKTAIKKPP